MAKLSSEGRARVWRGLMRHWSKFCEAIGALSKTDLRAFVDYTDDWVEANQVSYDDGMPEPARSELTAAQKSLGLCAVVLARVSVAMLRRVLGEVD